MKFLRPLAVATLALLGFLADAPSARGALISGTITGQVVTAGSALSGITVGSLVTGSYTYDNSTTVADILGPVNPFTAFSLSIGSNPRVFTLADLQTGNTVTPGRVPANSTSTADSLFFFFDFAVISNYVGATVSQQSLSAAPPQVYTVTSDAAHALTFNFTGVSAAAVPEPSTFTLLGLGCVALAGCGWRSRGWRLA